MHATAESAEVIPNWVGFNKAPNHYSYLVNRQPSDFLCETCLENLTDYQIESATSCFSMTGLLDAKPNCIKCGKPLQPTHHLTVAVA